MLFLWIKFSKTLLPCGGHWWLMNINSHPNFHQSVIFLQLYTVKVSLFNTKKYTPRDVKKSTTRSHCFYVTCTLFCTFNFRFANTKWWVIPIIWGPVTMTFLYLSIFNFFNGPDVYFLGKSLGYQK